ncbi:MAG: hypothetical protein AB8B74_03430 [Crocinitomicaceae bacterium]
MGKILAILFILFSSIANAGYIQYYKLVNEGEYQMYEGHYQLASTNFEMAFNLVESPKPRDYYLNAKCYTQLNDDNMVFKYLKLSVENGLDKNFIIDDSLWFTNQMHSQEFKSILAINSFFKKQIKEKSEDFVRLSKDFKMNDIIKYYKYADKKDSTSENYLKFMAKYLPYQDSFRIELIKFCLNGQLPYNKKDLGRLHFYCIHFFYPNMPELSNIKKRFIDLIDKGFLSPMYYATTFDKVPIRQNTMYPAIKSEFGITEESVNQADLTQIIENRISIGLSQYYYDAPNYRKNYKPISINKSIKIEY